jgi:hypothetical protein
MIFYQGKACEKLGRQAEARAIFAKLVDYGRTHPDDEVAIDYFAVSLPDFLVFEEDLRIRNQIHCEYMMAPGYLGLGENPQATAHFITDLSHSVYHPRATLHKA